MNAAGLEPALLETVQVLRTCDTYDDDSGYRHLVDKKWH